MFRVSKRRRQIMFVLNIIHVCTQHVKDHGDSVITKTTPRLTPRLDRYSRCTVMAWEDDYSNNKLCKGRCCGGLTFTSRLPL
jgi:hypothetical protein